MKKVIMFLGLVMVSFFCCSQTSVQAVEFKGDSKSAIIMEASTKTILYEKEAHTPLAPASMTKMMSMYLVLEAIDRDVLAWDDVLTISEYAASLGGSQIWLKPGEEMSVEDLFKSVAIASANDSITALAEAVSGTEEAFVKAMNERAEEFGMKNTVFKNPTGLTADGHMTSAYDMALLAQRLLTDYEEVTTYTSMYEDYIREDSESPSWLVTTNKLVKYVDGVDGLKTGSTDEAGFCLTATAKREEMRVITVVMGASSSAKRNAETTEMIEYAYSQYEVVPQLSKGQVIDHPSHFLVKNQSYDVVLTEDINILKEKVAPLVKGEYEIVYDEALDFPIEVGEKIGAFNYYYQGKLVQSVPLSVKERVDKNSFVGLFTQIFSELLFGEDA